MKPRPGDTAVVTVSIAKTTLAMLDRVAAHLDWPRSAAVDCALASLLPELHEPLPATAELSDRPPHHPRRRNKARGIEPPLTQ
jgi:hypothetical protein